MLPVLSAVWAALALAEPPPGADVIARASTATADACVATVEHLPTAPYLDRADPRLRGELVVVLKAARRLLHFRGGALLDGQCWPIGLANGVDAHVGPKRREGDLATPEGWYRTSDKPSSRYHRAIAVHYPNLADADAGLAAGAISRADRDAIAAALAEDRKPPQQTPLGGEILIHGGGSATDWTLGCVALNDDDIDALRASLPPDLRFDVLILP